MSAPIPRGAGLTVALPLLDSIRLVMERVVLLAINARAGHVVAPPHPQFGGCKQSGYGSETDQQTLQNDQEVKNVLYNHDPEPLGFFV